VFITHLLFVVANPSLVSSLSLLLSSLASSCLLVSRNPWRVAATMYITSLPLWIVLGAPSPLSILINAALAPALSILLFLAALFSQWAPPTMASLPWQLLLEILQWLARHTASELTTVPVPSALVVVYSLSLLALRVQNEMFRLPDRPFYLADRSRPRLNVLQ
jgi:hypothetical protein